MKRSLLMGVRALLFGLSAFVLMALSGIQVRSSLDVAGFVLGAAVLWVLIERVFLTMKKKPGPPKPPAPPPR